MGRAIAMENELEKLVQQVAIMQNRMSLLEECMEELINMSKIEEKPVEKKAKKSNKK